MKLRSRFRTLAKWTGTTTASAIALAWLLNCWYYIYWGSTLGLNLNVYEGRLTLEYSMLTVLNFNLGFTWGPYKSGPNQWWFEYEHTGLQRNANEKWSVSIPLWAPVLLVALPTTPLWHRDWLAKRRARGNTCHNCNYDRTGLDPAAPCPECNTVPNLPK